MINFYDQVTEEGEKKSIPVYQSRSGEGRARKWHEKDGTLRACFLGICKRFDSQIYHTRNGQ